MSTLTDSLMFVTFLSPFSTCFCVRPNKGFVLGLTQSVLILLPFCHSFVDCPCVLFVLSLLRIQIYKGFRDSVCTWFVIIIISKECQKSKVRTSFKRFVKF